MYIIKKIDKLQATIEYPSNYRHISRSDELQVHDNNEYDYVLLSNEYWTMDFHHVPIHKWLFDRKKSNVTYKSSIKILTDHSNKHIYAFGNAKNVNIGEWIYRNKPDAFSSDFLPNNGSYRLT